MDTRTSPARLNIERIREVLQAQGCAAALIPSSDPHLSEYLPERWQGRRWASGFTGSVGTLALTLDKAALFVDSRYWVQAEREIAGSGIELVKTPSPGASYHGEWLCRNLAAGSVVAVDGNCSMRLGVLTASALRRPAFTWPTADDAVTNMRCVSAATSPLSAGPAPPLYGTCTMSRPASLRSTSISRRFWLPLPGEA